MSKKIPQIDSRDSQAEEKARKVYDLLGYRNVVDLVNTIISLGWRKMLEGTKARIRAICGEEKP